jgi:ribosome-binding factor A
MDPRRAERVSEAIREELDELIAYELSDPRIQSAGVVEVLISPDGRQARVRMRLDAPDVVGQAATLAALNGAKGFLRRELAARLDLFRVPDLEFEAAVSPGLEARSASLFRRIRRGRSRDAE